MELSGKIAEQEDVDIAIDHTAKGTEGCVAGNNPTEETR